MLGKAIRGEKMKKKLLLTIFTMSLFQFIFASTYQEFIKIDKEKYKKTIKALVVDENGNGVLDANVFIPEKNVYGKTNKKGYFSLEFTGGGAMHVEISKRGFLFYSTHFFKPAKKTHLKLGTIVLYKNPKEEIVVTGTRTEHRFIDVPVRTEMIDNAEIIETGAKNMYELLEKRVIPGVWVETSCTNCNFSSIRMQGLESGYCGLLFDGQPIFSTLAGVYGLRQILPENIERIEVIKGASSALYGSSAIGGVINIITKEPSSGKPQFNAIANFGKYNTLNLGSSFSMRKGNFAAILTAQKQKNDYADETGPKGVPDGYTDKVEQDNNYFSLKTSFYFLEDKHRITLFGRSLHAFRRGGYISGGNPIEDEYGNIIGYTRGIDDALDPDAEHITTDRREYGISYRGIFSGKNMLELNLITTDHERDATNGERPFHSKEDIFLLDAIYTIHIKNNAITAGINYRDESLDQRINWEDSPTSTSESLGTFIQDDIHLLENLDLILGLRYDHVKSTLSKDSAFSPRFAVKWSINSDINLRGSVGAGFKVPYLFAEDLHLCSAAPLIIVSPDIEPERAWSYNLSLTYSKNLFTFDINLFRADIKKKMALNFDEEKNIGFYDNAGDAYTQGIEVSTRIFLLKHLNLDGSFTYTDAKYNEKLNPEFEFSDRIMRVPNITARLGMGYFNPKLGVRLYFGGRLIGKQYVEREMIIEGKDELEYHIDHVDSYAVWDAKITKDIGSSNYSIFLGVDNIFGVKQSPLYNAEQEDTAAYIYAPTTGTYIYGGIRLRF
jgi:outer membrane receptor for ferrienterochelin and colicins